MAERNIWQIIGYDLLSLLYPCLCAACNIALGKSESILCTSCELHLPQTYYHLSLENPIMRKLWGRLPILHAAACYQYLKSGKVQHLLHQLKYRKNTDAGLYTGNMYGEVLKHDHTIFATADLIIPVPLHHKKLKQRGYNQSDFFAQGLSQGMGIPWNSTLVTRKKNTVTQTGKSREERWQNVDSIFDVACTNEFADKHIVVVDDVITTGSTIESCAKEISVNWSCYVSVLTLASAV